MNLDKDGLASLLERVREAKGPDKVLDRDILCAIDGWSYEKRGRDRQPWMYGAKGDRRDPPGAGVFGPPRPTQSIDAALALVERLLPGWDDMQEQVGGVFYAGLSDRFKRHKPVGAEGASRPLAILSALLTALKEVR